MLLKKVRPYFQPDIPQLLCLALELSHNQIHMGWAEASLLPLLPRLVSNYVP